MPMLPLLLWVVMFQAPAPGVRAAEASTQRFTTRSEVVMLHVSVLDGGSDPVTGLPREAFTVFEDGQPQDISFFDTREAPVTIGLVLDNSISMQRRRDAVIAAGAGFVDASHPEDELFVLHFNEHVWRGLPAGQLFSSDRHELLSALAAMRTRGQTAFFDGLNAALLQLEHGRHQKKVLIVVSDGADNASRTSFDGVLDKALRMDAVIYTVSIHDQYDSDGRPALLKKIAASTGGEAFFVRRLEEVRPTLDRIARDIRRGYTIGYTPAHARAGYRQVRVEARDLRKRPLTVRCRSGYER